MDFPNKTRCSVYTCQTSMLVAVHSHQAQMTMNQEELLTVHSLKIQHAQFIHGKIKNGHFCEFSCDG